MNTIAILAIWLVPPALITFLMFRSAFSVVLCVRHSSILYGFCRIRDQIALKAMAGDISEESELFRFLYVMNARIIHENKDHGLCYSKLFLEVRPWEKSQPSETTPKLFDEVEAANEDIRQLVREYANTMCHAVVSSFPLMLRAAIVMKLVRLLSKLPIVPKERREYAGFSLDLVNASGLCLA